MDRALQFILTGLGLGGMYAVVAVGFVLIHNVTRVVNFAQGEFVMLGAMSATTFQRAGLSMPVVVIAATVVAAATGVVVERLTIAPSQQSSSDVRIIITIGTAFLLQGVGLALWGPDPRSFPAFWSGPPISVFGATIARQAVLVIGFAVLVALGLWYFFQRSLIGKAMRAAASDPDAARLQGINPSMMSLLAYGVSAGLAGIAGVMIVPLTSASASMGVPLALKGFIAAVMGGLQSTPNAIVGGFVVGVLESLLGGYVSSVLKNALTFLLLFVLLVIRSRRGKLQGAQRV